MKVDAGDFVGAGRDAMARHAWSEAVDLLSEADRSLDLDGDGLALLGDAAWWGGRFGEAISARERAFAAYTSEGQNLKAARVAIIVAGDHFRSLAHSVAGGWYARAERLLSDEPERAAHGLRARDRAHHALLRGDLEAALEQATVALDIGTRVGDRDLQAIALQFKGQVLVAKGQVEEGLALQDEATVAAVS